MSTHEIMPEGNYRDLATESELKPCPFCGGAAERFNVPDDERDPNSGGSCIQCVRCSASTALHFDRKENLLSAWNSRAALKQD